MSSTPPPDLSPIHERLDAISDTLTSVHTSLALLNRSLDDQHPRIVRLEDLIISPDAPQNGLLAKQHASDQRHIRISRLSWLALSSGVTAAASLAWSKLVTLFSHGPSPHGP